MYGARSYGTGVDMWAVGCIFGEVLGKGPLLPGEHDIDQLLCVIKLLGNPSEATWPQLTLLPDYHKISFPPMPGVRLEDVLPDAAPSAVNLLRRLLAYNPEHRPSAQQLLLDDYFFEVRVRCVGGGGWVAGVGRETRAGIGAGASARAAR